MSPSPSTQEKQSEPLALRSTHFVGRSSRRRCQRFDHRQRLCTTDISTRHLVSRFLANVLIGAFAAFASWSFYGSGAGVELAAASERTRISFTFSALAGAFLVGVAGAKWITNEVDKKLLKESIKIAGTKKLTSQECEKLVAGSALQVLHRVEEA